MKKCIAWQRARTENQIEQRIDSILQAAAELFTDYRLDQITLAMIGKKASFTRSNLYRYFSTKEEIYLQLLAHDIQQWCDRALLLVNDESIKKENFVKPWVVLKLEYTRLLTLFSLLYPVIEANVSDESLAVFKRSINADIERITTALVQKKRCKTKVGARQFVLAQTSLISGMHTMINLPARQKKLMQELDIDFNEEESMQTILTSVRALYEVFAK